MNIYDIAKQANVSIATVSRVLNGGYRVKDSTRRRVEEVLKKNNYVPSAIARGMMTKSMKTIGIVTIDIRNLYYANVSHSIEQSLSILGFNTILCNTGYDTTQKVNYLKMLSEKKVDSIILVGSIFKDPELDKPIGHIAKSIPVIFVNGHYDLPNTYSVQCNDKKALHECVEYLYHKGRKNFLYMYDADTFSGNRKLAGFREAVSEYGLRSEICYVKTDLQNSFDKIQKLLDSEFYFDAILTSEDLIAVSALQCLIKNGISVPGQVSIMGFNNSILSMCCTPHLSTVDSRMEDMGNIAVKILHRVLSGEPAEPSTMIDARLVFRETT
ncbi:MAG: LacI family transcriptional regulator [Clostridiaceae bacterium]|jgi:LacI family transcriptional regulator|nr:LacI family transcriptional regulator [Clostridiaceae bacterium]